jgi:hypothetical protein
MLFEIQHIARNILKDMGKNDLIKFRSEEERPPFFEKTLLIALSLAVEHMIQIDTPMSKTCSVINTYVPLGRDDKMILKAS